MKGTAFQIWNWFGAGFNLLLLFVCFITIGYAGMPMRLPTASIVAVAILAVGLWILALRTFSRSSLQSVGSDWFVLLDTLALGLGLAGCFAWLQAATGPTVMTRPHLALIALGGALGLKAIGWVLRVTIKPPGAMSETQESTPQGSLRDYLLLTKPIVLALLLVTTLAAMIVAAGGIPPGGLIAWTMIGGALSAGGASALNQYIDRARDAKMTRTQRRPLPRGRLHPRRVIIFGTLLCVAGFFTLALLVNTLSALLSLGGMIYYIVLYSLILKQTTPLNIVIGGGAGAIPPLVCWAAAVDSLSMPAFFLFALVFFWTPPHFWALALIKRRDYARAGVPMLPVIHGPIETRWQIMLYTVQVVALTLLLPLANLGGQFYLSAALLLGGGLVFFAWRLWRQGGNQPAYRMYRYSSTYLALIFGALVMDTFF